MVKKLPPKTLAAHKAATEHTYDSSTYIDMDSGVRRCASCGKLTAEEKDTLIAVAEGMAGALKNSRFILIAEGIDDTGVVNEALAAFEATMSAIGFTKPPQTLSPDDPRKTKE